MFILVCLYFGYEKTEMEPNGNMISWVVLKFEYEIPVTISPLVFQKI